MRQISRWLVRWLSALLVTVLVLCSLAACGRGTDRRPPAGAASETVYADGTSEAAVNAGAVSETANAGMADGTSEAAAGESSEAGEPEIDEQGTYTSKEEVALYLHRYGKLPSNFITKKEAEDLGWKKKQGHAGDLGTVAPGKSIGGSRFGNYEGQLPEKKGRKYYECDINYQGGSRGAERIVYSDDGLVFYTGDHYKTFEQLYPEDDG